MSDRFVTTEGGALSRVVREHSGAPWARVKKWIQSGKVFVAGERITDAGYRVAPGSEVSVEHTAPRPRNPRLEVRVVYEDRHLVVVDKPAGMSAVPYERGESGTALSAVRDAWRRQGLERSKTPLLVVHRIDKATSGLLAFAKSKSAERGLAAQLRTHSMERRYVCVAHGVVTPGRISSRLVANRGDGLRGSTRDPRRGKAAVTHIEVREVLARASVCDVRLETGRTHQIRIHLAESGHPLVGDPVYTRDMKSAGLAPIEAPRLLLHATSLGFEHPIGGDRIELESPLPDDFTAALAALAR